MKPSLKSYEREAEEIEADFSANLISRRERDKAIKNLWQDWKDIKEDYLQSLDEEDWDD